MDSLLSDIDGVGNTTLRIFHHAGFAKVGDVYSRSGQEDAVRAAAMACAEADGIVDRGHWRALATRCINVIRRIRSAEARSVEPEHFLCPITYLCMEDPVITRYGYTYERHAIERIAQDPDPGKRLDPIARQLIVLDDLFPNRALRKAIDYHHDHSVRFSVPFRVR